MKRFVCLFAFGGAAYVLLERLWRGYSHWTMFLLGGTCFHLIGRLAGRLQNCRCVTRAIACSAAITAAEYISGCFLNVRCKLNVWDYSKQFANIRGQVCLLYSLLWGALSLPAAWIYCRLERRLLKGSSH